MTCGNLFCWIPISNICLSKSLERLLEHLGDERSRIDVHLLAGSVVLLCKFLNSVGIEIGSSSLFIHVVSRIKPTMILDLLQCWSFPWRSLENPHKEPSCFHSDFLVQPFKLEFHIHNIFFALVIIFTFEWKLS